jgi:hypothetical protein
LTPAGHTSAEQPADPTDLGATDPLQLVDEVPTARQVDGKWIVGAMPSSELVTKFVNTLTTGSAHHILFGPYATTSDDPFAALGNLTSFNRWWRSYQDSDAPIDDWAVALDESEQALLDKACATLSSIHIDALVSQLKTTVYPTDWGSSGPGAGQFRFTADRLFDRLRLNYFTGRVSLPPLDPSKFPLPWRMAEWVSHDGKTMPPQTTIFGRRHGLNGFYTLDGRLSSSGTPLGSLVGLTEQPDTFALPLDWSEAVHSGLAEGLEAKLSSDLQKRLASFGDDVKAGVDALDAATFWGRLFGALSIPLGPGGPIAAILLTGVTSSLADAIDHWPAALKRAAANDAYLDDVGYELLHMLRVTDYDGVFEKKIEDALGTDDNVLFIGVSPTVVKDIESALRPSTTSGFQPMILLGDLFAYYAQHFGRTPFQVGGIAEKTVVVNQEIANDLWTEWWNDARPTLDLAYLLDTAGIVLEQLLHLDDALLAVNSLAAGEGIVASALRDSLDTQDLGPLSEGLGGASPSAILRFAFRQLWTDLFMDWIGKEQEGTTGTDQIRTVDLYPVFNWMGSKKKRDQIDAVLGPVLEVTPENAGSLYKAYQAFALVWGYTDHPLSVRGWMLPNAADADRGAFGRIITALFGPGIDGITLGDIGLVRDWLQSARESRLDDLREQLEPNWDFPSSDGKIPDDLPGLDEAGHGPPDSGESDSQGPVVVKNISQKQVEQKPVAAKKAAATTRTRSRQKSKQH